MQEEIYRQRERADCFQMQDTLLSVTILVWLLSSQLSTLLIVTLAGGDPAAAGAGGALPDAGLPGVLPAGGGPGGYCAPQKARPTLWGRLPAGGRSRSDGRW